MKDLNLQLQVAQMAWMDKMAEFKDSFGCIQMPVTPTLTQEYLNNCRVLANRETLLHRMKSDGIAAEVGVQTGRFSRSILNICRPSKLHLIDLDLATFSIREQFKVEIDRGIVQLHEGDSSSIIQAFPDGYFDFIYIDGDHSYEGVKRDIQAAISKVNQRGFLLFNDYTYWSPVECMRYGVIQAVNELCIEGNWEIVYFALEQHMYCDVAVRRMIS